MGPVPFDLIAVAAISLIGLAAEAAFAGSEDLGNGFLHHGVATPVSNHRGTVATVDEEGRNVVLVLLFSIRGGYALLMIDAETGKSEQFPTPFPFGSHDCPYASILSSRGKFYTHFGGHLVEFDPAQRAFTFVGATEAGMAMGMTEDDDGVIWAVSYPKSGVASFNPQTRELRDYGYVHHENWPQYQRPVAADDAGWIYFGIGFTASQIIALDPRTGAATPIIAEPERVQGSSGYVCRDRNGKVYGHAGDAASDVWYELHNGQARKITRPERMEPKAIITSSQDLFYGEFPDGKRLRECDLLNRVLVVEDPQTGEVRKLRFAYTTDGAYIMGVATAPNGTICGGTSFPMRFVSYDPRRDQWTNLPALGQWNTVARQGERFYAGSYGGGVLLEWDPSRPWAPTEKGNPACNPLFLTDCAPHIYRPHALLAHPDGKTLILAGTPDYGYTGGGLLFWDRETRTRVLLKHTDILAEHSTMSLAALPEGKLLGGTTTAAGTGGEKKAEQAELYIMDMATKRVEWHEPVLPGVQAYLHLCRASTGLVYGLADRRRFFVFDAAERRIVHQLDTEAEFGLTVANRQQGPRVFAPSPDGALYMLFERGVARVDLATHAITMLAESPVPIYGGGDVLDGRIYFIDDSRLYSYRLP